MAEMTQIMQTNPDPMGWPIPTGFFECDECGVLTSRPGADLHEQWHAWLDGKLAP